MKIALLIIGIIGILIGLAISGVSYGLHLANPRRISFDEAFPGVIGGCCCSSLALVIAVGGLAWMLLAPSKPKSKEDELGDEE